MRTPATEVEFLALLAEAVAEFDELALCVEEDLDDETADLAPTFQAIARSLRDVQQRIESGGNTAADFGHLACMILARTYRHVILFFSLLERLNRAHRQGFRSG